MTLAGGKVIGNEVLKMLKVIEFPLPARFIFVSCYIPSMQVKYQS